MNKWIEQNSRTYYNQCRKSAVATCSTRAGWCKEDFKAGAQAVLTKVQLIYTSED